MAIVYIDMDGVLCDYHGEHSRRIMINPKNQFPQAEWGFYLDLPFIDGAERGINAVSKFYDTWILTRPSVKNPLCYTEKRVWVEKNLGMYWAKKLIISPDKGLLRGDYLVDDQPWPNFIGKQVKFGTIDCPDWESVLKHLGVKW